MMALDAGLPADEFGLGVVGQAVIPICEKHPADHQRNNAGGEGDYEIALRPGGICLGQISFGIGRRFRGVSRVLCGLLAVHASGRPLRLKIGRMQMPHEDMAGGNR